MSPVENHFTICEEPLEHVQPSTDMDSAHESDSAIQVDNKLASPTPSAYSCDAIQLDTKLGLPTRATYQSNVIQLDNGLDVPMPAACRDSIILADADLDFVAPASYNVGNLQTSADFISEEDNDLWSDYTDSDFDSDTQSECDIQTELLLQKTFCVQCNKLAADCPGGTLKACMQCKVSHYCTKHCQAAHWKAGHRDDCVELASLRAMYEKMDLSK